MEDSEQQVEDVKVEPLTEDGINIKEEPLLDFQDEKGIKEEPLLDFPSYDDLKVEQKNDTDLSQDTLVPPEFVALNSIKTEIYVDSSSDVIGCEPSELNQLQTESCQIVERLESNDLFSCFICRKEFLSKYCAFFHKCYTTCTQKCDNVRNFPCKICKINCIDIVEYSKHIKEIHFACKICDVIFKNRTGLTLHENDHKLGLIFFYKCYCCGIEFFKLDQIQTHLLKEYPGQAKNCLKYVTVKKYICTTNYCEKQLLCPYCDLNFREIEFLLAHLKEQHKIVLCQACHNHFVVDNSAIHDQFITQDKKTFSSTQKSDSKLSATSRYRKIVCATEINKPAANSKTIKRIAECIYCGICFYGENEMIVHRQEVHKVFKCITCNNDCTLPSSKCSLCIAQVLSKYYVNSLVLNETHSSNKSTMHQKKISSSTPSQTIVKPAANLTTNVQSKLQHEKISIDTQVNRSTANLSTNYPLSTQYKNISIAQSKSADNSTTNDSLPQSVLCNHCGILFNKTQITSHKIQVHGIFKCLTCDNESIPPNFRCPLCINKVPFRDWSVVNSKDLINLNKSNSALKTERHFEKRVKNHEELLIKKRKLDEKESSRYNNVSKSYGHQCSYCFKIFEDIKELNKHLNSSFHPCNTNLPCLICGINLENLEDLENHMKHYHIACKICLITLKNVTELEMHTKIHTEQYYYKCICDKEFLTLKKISAHHKNDHLLKSSFRKVPVKIKNESTICNDNEVCPYCNQILKDINSLSVHKLNCHNVFRCIICKYQFARLEKCDDNSELLYCLSCKCNISSKNLEEKK